MNIDGNASGSKDEHHSAPDWQLKRLVSAPAGSSVLFAI